MLLLAAFSVWSFASIAWATDKGAAWDGANQTALYLVIFVLAAGWRWRTEDAVWLATGFGAVVAVIGLVTLVRAGHSPYPASYFIGARLSGPLGYPNAAAAFYLLAFWPPAVLASRREISPSLRLIQIVVATILLELSAIPQSRGATYTLPFVFLAALCFVPGRLRLLATLLPVGAVTAAALPALWNVYSAASKNTGVHSALVGATEAILISAIAIGVIGAVFFVVDARWRPEPGVARTLRLGFAAFLAAGVLAVLGFLVHRVPHPIAHLSSSWASFRHGSEPKGATHFVGLGSNRYDFWRVSWHVFERHPVAGIGVENFAAPYVAARHSLEEPRYPHSLEFSLLAGTGLVGALLFLAFVVALGLGVLRGRRPPFRGAVESGALLAFVSWLLHGSVDWLWEFPVLSGAAFLLAGVALSLACSRTEPAGAPARARGARRLVGVVAAGLTGLAVVASMLPPWLSARDVDLAARTWPVDRARAYALLQSARSLNPLSDQPDLTEGAIASRVVDPARMRVAFLSALARNPADWYANLELGTVAAVEGHRSAALDYLARAERQNPLQYVISLAYDRAKAGRPLGIPAVDRLVRQESDVTG